MPELRPLKTEDWEEFHKTDVEIFPDDAIREESFRKGVRDGGFFALTLDGEIIGHLDVNRFGKDGGYLRRIGIVETHRGKGFGSMLMEYALEWFRKQESIKTVQLQADLNEAALGLYVKYGFKKVGTTWHYFVPYDSIKPKQKYSCQEIQEDEIESVSKQYSSLPREIIRRYLASEEYHVLTLKDKSGRIVGVCRFTPSFPGCFPFEITSVECFNDFITGLMKFKLPEHDYCRVVYTNIPKLAELCEKRKYRLHHKLHKMTLQLK